MKLLVIWYIAPSEVPQWLSCTVCTAADRSASFVRQQQGELALAAVCIVLLYPVGSVQAPLQTEIMDAQKMSTNDVLGGLITLNGVLLKDKSMFKTNKW